ncbi:hypothetical protein D3C72_1287140 [compost metagenome]
MYSGLAIIHRGAGRNGRACNVESVSGPMRIAMSVRCSIKSTMRSLLVSSSVISGYSRRNSPTCGTTQCSITGTDASTRKRPAGR